MNSRLRYGVWLILLGVGNLQAQCPPPASLKHRVQALVQAEYPVDTGKASRQTRALTADLRQWKACGYQLDSMFVKGLLRLSKNQFYQGKYTIAVDLALQSLSLCQNAPIRNNPYLLEEAWFRLGVTYIYQRETSQALSSLKKIVALSNSGLGNSEYLGDAYSYLAYIYTEKGDFETAEAHARAGLGTPTARQELRLKTELMHQQAQSLYNLDRLPEALSIIQQAIGLLDKKSESTTQLIKYYRLVGRIGRRQRNFTMAQQYLEKALTLSRTIKTYESFNILISLATLYNKQGQYAKALTYTQQALHLSHDKIDQGYALDQMGWSYAGLHRWEQAQAIFHRGVWTVIGDSTGFRGRQHPSARRLRPLEAKDIALSLLQDQGDALLNQYQYSRNQDHLRQASRIYQIADSLIDFMRWEQTGTKSKLYWRETTRPTYEQALQACYLLKDMEQAFRFIEKSRAVLLSDKLNELGASRYLTPEQAQKEQEFKLAVIGVQNELADKSADTPTYAGLLKKLLHAQNQLEEFLQSLEQSNKVYFRYKYDQNTITLTQLQQWLKTRQSSYITYFVGDSALYMLSVTPTKVSMKRTPLRPYTNALKTFMDLQASSARINKQNSRFLLAANSLYQQVFAPLDVPSGRLIVSPDGFYFPFETLSRSATEPDYLLRDYAISYTYSARQLLEKPSEPTGSRLSFLGIAPVNFEGKKNLASLTGSDDALATIGDLFFLPKLLTGKSATRQAFIDQAPTYDIVQLTTHADADTTTTLANPSEPVLYFSDTTLRLSELPNNIKFKPRLVVMSACKTALGIFQKGEGVFSMARGFTMLGVPSVVTTLWSVEDKATYALTQLFYKNLAEGLPKDVALQQAKKQFMAQGSRADQLPVRWAGLILVGDTEPIDFPSNLFLYGVISLLAALFIALSTRLVITSLTPKKIVHKLIKTHPN